MTRGMTAKPSLYSNRVANNIDVSGSLSITVHMAPMPMGTARHQGQARREYGGSKPCAAAVEPGDGKTGPPRKQNSEITVG